MKHIILFIFSFLFAIGVCAQNSMKAANDLYAAEKYEEAAAMYQSLLNTGQESSALYYNLGNAYYKTNEIAPAILNYERASLLRPNNEDIQFNLELCRSKIVDKIDVVDIFFLRSWTNNLAELMSSNSWATLSIATFLVFIVALFSYIFGRYNMLKKTAFFVGCIALLISVSSFFMSSMQKNKYVDHPYAIVMDDSVTVKSSPDESGTDLFLVHEGTKVKVRKVFENQLWVEIQLEDGNAGWVKTTTIERI